ncbi:acetyl-CoA synthetase-like protein [Amniculicola lignicola CBS 123094]|uniref:Acetyl-CoA synthetase-like protein n=1 Tax=Amniculicola lignicola CBS 123094 TaxID=1392246 RepID=A0A6A5VYQ1_9PLEO|nr:acetyl-CoA synthetase-like protein [Amniculicola lignicola CBS 123094]
MPSLPQWFQGTTLNWAENILFTASSTEAGSRNTLHKEDSKVAVTEIREGNSSVQNFTWRDLREKVGLLSNAFRNNGVKKGDRVAVVASTSFDTLCCFLAITTLGGLFSSSSTDMGTKGILERLLQIKPVYVFIDDWAVYNGQTHNMQANICELIDGMKGVTEFQGVVTQPRFENEHTGLKEVERTTTLDQFLTAANGDTTLRFERVNFSDPFLVVYSSGTTGMPKCIVHSTGGILISALKEIKLHREQGPESVVLQYTTTGWIMYLVSVQCLLVGSRTIMYDGSPFLPSIQAFLNIVSEQKVTHLGTSPRYLTEVQKKAISPRDIADHSSLRAVITTGMVLSNELFEWFYDTAFPPHVQLCNIAGGTDLAGSFAQENPLTPVHVGGCQGPSLGQKVQIFDSIIEHGKPGIPVPNGEPGELVGTVSFPNQPVYLWGDESGEMYHKAYYARYPGVWTQGDFIQIHPVTGQIFFLGRADGVLNPSGVRFGSSDIYSVIESHFPAVMDSLCVGQRREGDVDESVMLFLKMKEGERFSKGLVESIRKKIEEERSKRHVPRYVFETWDIPATVNGKKVELPVKQIVSGKIIKPSGTLANPESLQYYYQFAKVEDLLRSEKEVGAHIKSKL